MTLVPSSSFWNKNFYSYLSTLTASMRAWSTGAWCSPARSRAGTSSATSAPASSPAVGARWRTCPSWQTTSGRTSWRSLNYFLCLDLNYFLHSREELLEELKEKAVNVGANAIIGLRWTREYLCEICENMKYSVGWRPTPCSRECSTWWWWGLPCISWDDSVHTEWRLI